MLSAYQNQVVSLKLQTVLYTNLKQTLCSPLSKDQCIKQKQKMALMKKHYEWNTLTKLFSKSLQMHTVDVHCAHIHLKSTMNFFCKIRTLLGSILWSM